MDEQKNNNLKSNAQMHNIGKFFVGFFIVVVGLFILANNVGWIDLSEIQINWSSLWPILIILFGLSMITSKGAKGMIFGIFVSIITVIVCMVFIFVPGVDLRNEGEIITQERVVSGFNEIDLRGFGNLIIEQSDKESLKMEARKRILSKIETKVDDGRLVIEFERMWPWEFFNPKEQINFYVSAANLNKISVSGAANIESRNIKSENFEINVSGAAKSDLNIETKNLKVDISGAGKFFLAGIADNQFVSISGAGKYDAENLKSQEVKIRISGAGESVVSAEKKLIANISGASRLYYLGNPEIIKEVSGTSSIDKLIR